MPNRWFILVTLLAATPVRAADERPQTLGEAKAKEQVTALAEVATLPILTLKSPADIIQLSIQDNDLVVSTKLPLTERAVARAPGLAGLSTVSVTSTQIDPTRPPMETFNFDNFDYSVPGVVAVHTSVGQSPGKLTIVQEQDRLDDQVHSVQLIQSTGEIGEGDHRIMLYVQITAAPEVNKKLPADNIVELRRLYPAETTMYLDPIFRTLRQPGFLSRVDPRLAWQVFGDAFVASPQLQSQIKTILAKLDADDFRNREAASRELDQLGQPAALALMRMDRTGLSDEQRGRVDAFVTKFKPIPPEQVERLRRDRDFLLDCLFADDQGIRTRALQQLQKVVGKPIDFDVSADAEHRLAAISTLRAGLGAPAAPATTQSQADQ